MKKPCGWRQPWHRWKRMRDLEVLDGLSEKEQVARFVDRKPYHWLCDCARAYLKVLEESNRLLEELEREREG